MRRANGWRFLAVAVCALALIGPAAADDKATDKQVYDTLRDVINKGADLYNGGDWSGCYRLYEGALIATKPVLAHRAPLQKAIDTGLATAGRTASLADRAFVLRKVIDQVRDETNPNPKPPAATTLWDKYKEAGFKKVIGDFVKAAGTDPKVDFTRGGKFKIDQPKLERLLLEQFSELTGGPLKYSGRDMKESHKGMGITEEQFAAAAGHLKKALESNGVEPADVTAIMTKVATTKADIVEGKKPDDPPKPTTLWDKYKEEGFKKVIDDFVKTAGPDPKVDFTRGNKFPLDDAGIARLKRLILEQFSELTGGPYKYSGRTMKESHKGMGITEEQFTAAAGHLRKALEGNGVSKADADAIMAKVATTKDDIVEKKSGDSPKPDDKKPEDKKPEDKKPEDKKPG